MIIKSQFDFFKKTPVGFSPHNLKWEKKPAGKLKYGILLNFNINFLQLVRSEYLFLDRFIKLHRVFPSIEMWRKKPKQGWKNPARFMKHLQGFQLLPFFYTMMAYIF